MNDVFEFERLWAADESGNQYLIRVYAESPPEQTFYYKGELAGYSAKIVRYETDNGYSVTAINHDTFQITKTIDNVTIDEIVKRIKSKN